MTPHKPAAAAANDVTATGAAAPPRQPRALILVDNPLERRLFGLMLEHGGFDIQAAAAPDQALALAHAAQAAVILLDMSTATQSAYELLQRLRLHPSTATAPIVVLSTQTSVALIDLAFELGADDYLVKPVRMSLLLPRIQVVMRRQRRIQALQQQVLDLQQQNHYLYHTFSPASLDQPESVPVAGHARIVA